MIGTALHHVQDPLVCLDSTNKEEVETLIKKHHITLIINCAAIRYPDQIEKNKQLSEDINSIHSLISVLYPFFSSQCGDLVPIMQAIQYLLDPHQYRLCVWWNKTSLLCLWQAQPAEWSISLCKGAIHSMENKSIRVSKFAWRITLSAQSFVFQSSMALQRPWRRAQWRCYMSLSNRNHPKSIMLLFDIQLLLVM